MKVLPTTTTNFALKQNRKNRIERICRSKAYSETMFLLKMCYLIFVLKTSAEIIEELKASAD